jgi:HAD superfamily hydrolase (TIGR01484 family)
MPDFSHILLLADFDRTLTDPESRIPARNVEAIRAFQAQGGAFTVATGRSIPMFLSREAEIPYNVPLILYNGGAFYDYRTDELRDACWIPEGRALLAYLAREFPDMNLEVQGKDFHYLIGELPMRDAFYRRAETAFRHVTVETMPMPILKASLLGTYFDDTVPQFFKICPPEEVARFDAAQAKIQADWPELVVDRASPRILDIQGCGVSKGRAARNLANRLSRELVCVGDARNDLSILLEADRAFAPGDCEQAVREAGVSLVCPCADGAVADVIELLGSELDAC